MSTIIPPRVCTLRLLDFLNAADLASVAESHTEPDDQTERAIRQRKANVFASYMSPHCRCTVVYVDRTTGDHRVYELDREGFNAVYIPGDITLTDMVTAAGYISEAYTSTGNVVCEVKHFTTNVRLKNGLEIASEGSVRAEFDRDLMMVRYQLQHDSGCISASHAKVIEIVEAFKSSRRDGKFSEKKAEPVDALRGYIQSEMAPHWLDLGQFTRIVRCLEMNNIMQNSSTLRRYMTDRKSSSPLSALRAYADHISEEAATRS